jgi:hypothetical protein
MVRRYAQLLFHFARFLGWSFTFFNGKQNLKKKKILSLLEDSLISERKLIWPLTYPFLHWLRRMCTGTQGTYPRCATICKQCDFGPPLSSLGLSAPICKSSKGIIIAAQSTSQGYKKQIHSIYILCIKSQHVREWSSANVSRRVKWPEPRASQ